jgi:uncharacterized DUF497 family protein
MKLCFEWDANKERANYKKHKVSFEESKTIFNDPLLITFRDDEHSDDEERFISVGTSSNNKTFLVVHLEETKADTMTIRIISCRKATPAERKRYEEGKK